MVGAEIDCLDISSSTEIPEVDPMAIFVGEQILRHDPVLELRWQRPLARYHVVARQVPPEVIVQGLRTTIDLPAPEDIECLAVHDEDAGRSIGTILATATESADVNALWSAVNSMGPRVAGLFKDLLRFDYFVNLRLGGIRFRIHDINSRGTHPWNYEVAPFEERMPRERRQRRRAGVPAEMVKLVTLVGHHHRVNHLTESRRARLYVDDCERVGF